MLCQCCSHHSSNNGLAEHWSRTMHCGNAQEIHSAVFEVEGQQKRKGVTLCARFPGVKPIGGPVFLTRAHRIISRIFWAGKLEETLVFTKRIEDCLTLTLVASMALTEYFENHTTQTTGIDLWTVSLPSRSICRPQHREMIRHPKNVFKNCCSC